MILFTGFSPSRSLHTNDIRSKSSVFSEAICIQYASPRSLASPSGLTQSLSWLILTASCELQSYEDMHLVGWFVHLQCTHFLDLRLVDNVNFSLLSNSTLS